MNQKKSVAFEEMTLPEKKKHISENYEKMRMSDARMVRGKFILYECPGGLMEFNFRKYKGDPIARYSLYDGQIYTIPLAVAKHLNSNCAYAQYSFVKGDDNMVQATDYANGNIMKVTHRTNRCAFQSLEFLDEDFGSSASISMVEKVA